MSGLDQNSKDIVELLSETGGLTAGEIAECLQLDKKEVNALLYGSLKNQCYQDNSYVWRLKTVSRESLSDTNQATGADEMLSKLCRYYLNCIGREENSGIRKFASGYYGVDYIELPHVDFTSSDVNAANHLLKKMKGQKGISSFVGYPVLIQKNFSKKDPSKPYYMVVPVFLFDIKFANGQIEKDTLPRINMELIKHYAYRDVNEQISELVELENQLGLNNDDIDIEMSDLIIRLKNIRAWQWQEEMDPLTLSAGPALSSVDIEGIYNRAIFIIAETPMFTKGLESELTQLSTIQAGSYSETALYKWIYGNRDTKEKKDSYGESDRLLEVLPLNIEQEQGIYQALNEDITIITGPPGTGKSQVVTNLILNAAWRGKKVLFSSKNNKAVDVVEMRVNGLGRKPVMLRAGNRQYAYKLSEIIDELLSGNADVSDKEEYKYYVDAYNKKGIEKEELQAKKEKTINLRNRIDRVERELCEYRDDKGNYINGATDSAVKALKGATELLVSSYNISQRSKQPFFIRLFWPFFVKQRQDNLKGAINSINLLFEKYNIQLVSRDLTLVRDEDIQEAKVHSEKQIHVLNVIMEYEGLLEQLRLIEPLEIIDEKLFALKQTTSDIASKLWSKLLDIRPLKISAEDRKEMVQFVAAMKLSNDSDISKDSTLNATFKKLQAKVATHLPCWAVTSLSASGSVPFQPGIFDLVVIDEASQCDIASMLPLLYRAKNAVILGDPKQLSHISTVSNAQDAALLKKYEVDLEWSYSKVSLYGLASSLVCADDIVALRDHHRSFADIIEFSNNEFYGGNLRVATKYSLLNYPRNAQPGISWVDIPGETKRPSIGGAYNSIEAARAVKEIKTLIVDNGYKGSVGLVTPFRAQADLIRDEIAKDENLSRYLAVNNDFLVDTVHKFQGDERDVMFFSLVISKNTNDSSLRFLSNTGNLFNVAITRARSMLIVIGDLEYCTNCSVSHIRNFIKYFKKISINSSETQPNNIMPQTSEYPIVSNPHQVSDWEKLLYSALFREGIVAIPQYQVDKYRLDLAIIEGDRKIDIEVDGEMYHRDWSGELCYRDQLRNHRLIEMGWSVKRFWVYQIRDQLPWCIDQIKKWCDGA